MQITKKILRTVSSPSAFVKVWNKTPLWRFSRLLADSVYFRKIRQRRVLLGFNNQQESVHLKALRDQGFSVITDLVDQSILDELRSYSEGKLQRANEIAAQQVVGTKSFWIRLSDDDLAEKALDEKHILVKFGIQKRLIELVGRYLGELPVLRYPLLTYSQFSKQKLQQSQLWHLDRDDVRMLKIFVYLTDVSSIEDGPFTFIPLPASKKVKNGFFMKHLPDEAVIGKIGSHAKCEMICPKLTVFAVDTSKCYHMGSRVKEGHSRLMYTALYTPAVGIYSSNKAGNYLQPSAEASEGIRRLLRSDL